MELIHLLQLFLLGLAMASPGHAAATDEPDEATLRLQREFQERVDINCGEQCCENSHRRRLSPPMRL